MKYPYKCTNCLIHLVIEHSMKDNSKTYCTVCKLDTLQRVITPPCISFKGSGWTSKELRSNSLSQV